MECLVVVEQNVREEYLFHQVTKSKEKNRTSKTQDREHETVTGKPRYGGPKIVSRKSELWSGVARFRAPLHDLADRNPPIVMRSGESEERRERDIVEERG